MSYKHVVILLLVSFAITGILLQAQTQRPLPTHHVRQAVINGEAPLVGLLPGTLRMRVGIMLPLRNQAELDSLLQDLYDPNSPLYGQYLTVREFTDRFGPTQEDYDAVVAFAKANGMTVTGLSPNRLVIDVIASVATIEQAFHVILGVYQHPSEDRTFYAPDREPWLDLNVPLWHIAGLDNFSLPRPLFLKRTAGVRSNTLTGSGASGTFLGSDRRAAYYGGTSLTGAGQSVGLFEIDGYNISDVNNYFTNVHQTRSVPISNVLLRGDSGGSDGDDTEQVIDIIDAISMAPGMSQVLVYIAPYESGSDVAIFNQMATDNKAKQLSVSWGWADDSGSDDPIFEQMATQGQSVFAASGDSGSYPNSSGGYYPAEDANVTAVGGTELTTNGAGGSWASEVAWGTGSGNLCPAGGSSGGGISPDGIPIPSYQQLAGVINSSNKGSTTLRNIPDVAAEANCDNYFCANGSCSPIEGSQACTTTNPCLGGTSLAAPTLAGFAALVNQNNVANGKSTLGFLNPFIYSIGGLTCNSYFHDIASGSNGTYSAVPGYDLVTGWGSPDGPNWFLAPDFCLGANPSQQTIQGPGTVYYTVSVAGSPEFNGNVAWTCKPNTPAVVSCSLNPTSGWVSQLQVTSNGKAGTWGITVTGTSGTLIHSAVVTLVVQSPG